MNRGAFYHLKVGTLNFWPDRGTLTIDGEGRMDPDGLDAFKELVLRLSAGRKGQGQAVHSRAAQGPDTSASNVVHLKLQD